MIERLKYILYIMSAVALIAACTENDDGLLFDKSAVIDFVLPRQIAGNALSRGYLYEDDAELNRDSTLYKEEYGGGNFWVKAFHNNTVKQYIDSRVWYFADGKRWWFRSQSGLYDCYWPKNGTLNFFAYMPWQTVDAAVTVGGYSYAGGPEFSCELPLNNTAEGLNQATLYEFVYAFTKDRRYDGPTSEPVELSFVHPMSAIYFRLKQSHRDLTIHSIGFEKIYNKGTYSYGEATTKENSANFADNYTYNCWTPEDARKTMAITVEKTVPDSINFNAEIGGPFIVMPQAFQGAAPADTLTLYITYSWDELDHVTKGVALKNVHTADIGWQPGKKYVYNIDLGDNKEEILFRVLVEPWDTVGYKNVIDVD